MDPFTNRDVSNLPAFENWNTPQRRAKHEKGAPNFVMRRMIVLAGLLALCGTIVYGCSKVVEAEECTFSEETRPQPAIPGRGIQAVALQINGVNNNTCLEPATEFVRELNNFNDDDIVINGRVYRIPVEVVRD